MTLQAAEIGRGPFICKWRGTTFLHKGNLELPLDITTFDVDVAGLGIVRSRYDIAKPLINLTPSGRVQEVAALINRYATSVEGDLLNVEEFPATVNTGTSVLTTATAHLLAAGDEVLVRASVTMPTGVSRNTRYYAGALTSTTLKLYDTEENAITGGATGLVAPSAVGEGVILCVTRALTITTLKGLEIKYYNVGLTKVPDLQLSAVKTLLGQAEFTAFVRLGQDPDSAADRYYKIRQTTAPTISMDPNDIKTQHPKLTWDWDPVWTNLQTKDGVTISFDLTSNPLPSDAFGEDALARIFGNIMPTATLSPQGLTEAEMLAAAQIQSKVRGGDLAAGALELATAFYTFAMADAYLSKSPMVGSSSEQRAGNFEWKCQRSFTGGAPDPLFELIVNE